MFAARPILAMFRSSRSTASRLSGKLFQVFGKMLDGLGVGLVLQFG